MAGPAAAEAARRLGDFGERARFRGLVVTDTRQLQRLMQRDDPAVYPGTYATCVFNPDRALCQRQHDTNNRQLRDQLELATAVIQRITLENQRLRQQLETAAKVTSISAAPSRQGTPAP